MRRTEAGAENLKNKSLSKGLKILGLFSANRPEWNLNSIAKEAGVPRATAYRLLRTLEEEEYLVFDDETARYQVGPALLPMVNLLQDDANIARILRPDLQDLAVRSGGQATLAVERANGIAIIDSASSFYSPAQCSNVTERMPKGSATSHAKVFGAFKDDSSVAFLASRPPQTARTRKTITDPGVLAEEFARVKREGVAYDLEEYFLGVSSVGAPVFDRSGAVAASVAAVFSADRFGLGERAEIGEMVKACAASMSARLGYVAAGEIPCSVLTVGLGAR